MMKIIEAGGMRLLTSDPVVIALARRCAALEPRMPIPRLGAKQLDTLAAIASPNLILLLPKAHDLRLVAMGYAQHLGPDSKSICITPAGLRRLADEIEAGRVKDGPTLAAERRARAN